MAVILATLELPDARLLFHDSRALIAALPSIGRCRCCELATPATLDGFTIDEWAVFAKKKQMIATRVCKLNGALKAELRKHGGGADVSGADVSRSGADVSGNGANVFRDGEFTVTDPIWTFDPWSGATVASLSQDFDDSVQAPADLWGTFRSTRSDTVGDGIHNGGYVGTDADFPYGVPFRIETSSGKRGKAPLKLAGTVGAAKDSSHAIKLESGNKEIAEGVSNTQKNLPDTEVQNGSFQCASDDPLQAAHSDGHIQGDSFSRDGDNAFISTLSYSLVQADTLENFMSIASDSVAQDPGKSKQIEKMTGALGGEPGYASDEQAVEARRTRFPEKQVEPEQALTFLMPPGLVIPVAEGGASLPSLGPFWELCGAKPSDIFDCALSWLGDKEFDAIRRLALPPDEEDEQLVNAAVARGMRLSMPMHKFCPFLVH